jgi:hypothetical protein
LTSRPEVETIRHLLPPTDLKIDYQELCKYVTDEVLTKALEEARDGKVGKSEAPFWTVLMTGVVKTGKWNPFANRVQEEHFH